jgi:hypothetical protein
LSSHENLAHNHVLYFFGFHAGTLEGGLNCETAKVGCTE